MSENKCEMEKKECESCSKKGTCEEFRDKKLKQTLNRIKHKIVILSGKGGVGKSSIAANIAVGLSLKGKKVGLMDVDVHGPSIPRLLKLDGARPEVGASGMYPIPWSKNLSVISLGFLLPSKEDSVIWRGPLKMGVIKQFIADVVWGVLDYLVVDCPPGTGDEPLSVMQLMGKEARAVIVTTPQDVAVDDVRRSINFCRHTGNPVIGVIENMSGFVCPHCGKEVDIFKSGGGEALAKEAGVDFLGKIPLDPKLVEAGDSGEVFIKYHQDSPAAKALLKILEPILKLDEK